MTELPNDWFVEHDGQRLVLDPEKVRTAFDQNERTIRACNQKISELTMGEWRSIETAPKDGGDIILLSRNGIRVAHWTDGGYAVFTGWFIPLDSRPFSEGMFAQNATHWMPLPTPPTQTAQ